MELELDRVKKQFQNKIAVDRTSLVMKPGIYGLLGANGAGKTTLMRMIAGILKPDEGEIRLGDIEVSQEAYRDRLGYLPQEFGYYPNFKAWDFMMYMASLKGIPKAKAKVKTQELLETVGLSEAAQKKIKTFSGGMRQRLGIAQALLNNPRLMILDEPTAGLDPKERVRFRNMLSRLRRDRIILLSTHIVSDVEYIADQILVMKDGVILHRGSLDEIISAIRGKVWECRVSREKMAALAEKYAVINIREEQDGIFLRLVGDGKPSEDAREADAALEDLYLFYFSGEGEMIV